MTKADHDRFDIAMLFIHRRVESMVRGPLPVGGLSGKEIRERLISEFGLRLSDLYQSWLEDIPDPKAYYYRPEDLTASEPDPDELSYQIGRVTS